MRPIKFRVWDSINDRWFTEYYDVFIDQWGELFSESMRKSDTPNIEIDVMGNLKYMKLSLSTGLLDKNKIEIFEGDIVKWGHLNQWSREQPYRIAEVKFNPDIQFHSQVGVFNFGSFAYRDTTETDLEVIGNIYENPELLEEEE